MDDYPLNENNLKQNLWNQDRIPIILFLQSGILLADKDSIFLHFNKNLY